MMKASHKVRRTAGATAAMMAASSWFGVSSTARDASSTIVSLNDDAMAKVRGGDPVPIICLGVSVTRTVSAFGAAAAGEGATVISIPWALPAACAVYTLEQIFENQVVSYGQDILQGYEWLSGDLHDAVEVDGVYEILDGSATYQSSTIEDNPYCGTEGCACVDGSDCQYGGCDIDNGTCVAS